MLDADGECGTVPDSDTECETVPDNDRECGTVRDSASKRDMDIMVL